MRSNKEIRAESIERIKPVKKKLMLYTLVWLLIVTGLSIIPFLGFIANVLSPFFAIGLLLTVVNIFNGQGENESPISFFSHAFEMFVRTLCTYLWVLLRCIVGFIITIVGVVLFAIGGVGLSISSMSNSSFQGLGVLGIVGFILYLVGIIVLIIQTLRYQAIGYEIIHSDKSKQPKEIVSEAANHIEGHKGQWFCMALYYALLMYLYIILLAIVIGIITSIIENEMIATICVPIGLIFIFISMLPKMICSCEILYKEMVGGAPQNISNEEQPIN